MARWQKQAELGLRWLTCGARLFRRNPWLLAGMGFISAVLVAVLVSIPFIGAPLAGFFFPALVGAMLMTLETTAGQAPRPAPRLASVTGAPRALIGAFADESRLIRIVVLGLCSMAAVLLMAMLAWQLVGSAWWIRPDVDLVTYGRVVAAAVLVIVAASAAAAGFVYALPLAILQGEPLLPAAKRSVRAAARHVWALAVLEGVLLSPLLLGAIVSFFSGAAARLFAVIAGAVVFPVIVAGLYCSYRTLFPAPPKAAAAVRAARPPKTTASRV